MPTYNMISPEMIEKMNVSVMDLAIRRNMKKDNATVLRPCFIRDIEKIINCPYYNRYADKTQVFSFYKNDDISRRSLHVQLVSRIARNIGRLLKLDLDLIEAISLGHDIGHTPFGHIGEQILSNILHSRTGRYFHHNVQSVHVLDKIFNYNISLQTLNGVLCHNGEIISKEYKPKPLGDFAVFDEITEECWKSKNISQLLVPETLEGCVVRISDVIAYIGKDRQDALKTKSIKTDEIFEENNIGRINAAIINNLIVNIIENSYDKSYIALDEEHFNSLLMAKSDNYKHIYGTNEIKDIVAPMFELIYEKLYKELLDENENGIMYRHHIELIKNANKHYEGNDYLKTEKNQIVVDFIASMTDDYFIDLYEFLFPNKQKIKYISYFDKIRENYK